MRTILLGIWITALMWAAAGDQPLRDAEKAWTAAVVARDEAALNRIYDDELIYAHSTGAIESKKEYMDRLRTGKQKYDTITPESLTTRMAGDSGVTHTILRMTGTSNGKPFNDRLMMMHVWVKRGGAWKLLAHQTTKLP